MKYKKKKHTQRPKTRQTTCPGPVSVHYMPSLPILYPLRPLYVLTAHGLLILLVVLTRLFIVIEVVLIKKISI